MLLGIWVVWSSSVPRSVFLLILSPPQTNCSQLSSSHRKLCSKFLGQQQGRSPRKLLFEGKFWLVRQRVFLFMVATLGWFRKPTSLKFTTAAWTHPGCWFLSLEARRNHKGCRCTDVTLPQLEALCLFAAFCPEYQGMETGGSQNRHRIHPIKNLPRNLA
jgi:hypothetical protein